MKRVIIKVGINVPDDYQVPKGMTNDEKADYILDEMYDPQSKVQFEWAKLIDIG